MLPIFKSDFSIGKSILTLNPPQDTDEEGSDSIFSIALDNNLKELILVEDCLTGFLQANKNCKDLGINLIFGLRISVSESTSKDSEKSKIIIFAKNEKGCSLINKIYSFANVDLDGFIDYKNLSKFFTEDLLIVVPFYDSFIFNNIFYFKSCIPDFSFCNPQFFIEDNNLPFDSILSNKVKSYCKENGFEFFLSKSIFYKNKEDFAAFQTYKCICNRSFSKSKTLESPNLEHLSSDEFSFESYLNYESS
tara:strand:- start:285 stop:1031 length:747 start_codon:yes stop_codon:yes gene_type:complete